MATTTPEGRVKKGIKELLDELKIYYHMPVQNGMGRPTLDFICCAQGMYIAIEAKAEGGYITKIQNSTIRSIQAAGGLTYVVYGQKDLKQLKLFLEFHIEHAQCMEALEQ